MEWDGRDGRWDLDHIPPHILYSKLCAETECQSEMIILMKIKEIRVEQLMQ